MIEGHRLVSRRAWALSALAALAFAIAFQGSRPLWDPDEGRYVDVAIEMLHLGDLWTPHLHPEVPHFSKPPLTYWLVAASLTIFGHSEWAVRLPNALAFAAAILLVAAIARRLIPGREATAAVVYATSLLPFTAANIVTADTVLAAFVALGVLGFTELRWGSGPPGRARSWFAVGWGLAFLTKGPPALLSLAGLLLASRAVRPRPGHAERSLVSTPSFGLFALLAFGWYGYEVWTHPGLLGYLLGHEVVGRTLTAEFDRNAGWIGLVRAYGPVLLAGLLPWWPLALARRRDGTDRATSSSLPVSRLVAVWISVPFAAFAAAQSRLPLYLLPLAVPAALLVAHRLGPLPAGRRARTLLFGWIVLLLAVKAGAAAWSTPRDGRRRAAELASYVQPPPCEIVFVQSLPSYSLAFYLGCDIERVDLYRSTPEGMAPWGRAAENLGEEMKVREPGRLFLVPLQHVKAFVEKTSHDRRRVGTVGATPDALLYRELP